MFEIVYIFLYLKYLNSQKLKHRTTTKKKRKKKKCLTTSFNDLTQIFLSFCELVDLQTTN